MFIISITINNGLIVYAETIKEEKDKLSVFKLTMNKNTAKIFEKIEDITKFKKIYINNNEFTNSKEIELNEINIEKIELIKEIKVKENLKCYWNKVIKALKYYKKTFNDIEKIIINKQYIDKNEFEEKCKKTFITNNSLDCTEEKLPILIGKDFMIIEVYDDYENYFTFRELPL